MKDDIPEAPSLESIISWGEIYEQFAASYGWTIEVINNVTLCQALMFIHYKSKRIQSYFDFANETLETFLGSSDSVPQNPSHIPVSSQSMQDINSINISSDASRKAAKDMLNIKPGESYKDGAVMRKEIKGKAPWETQN